ncbi:SDR family oxidoreductase [Azospirillum sp. ST 5-10]|uniref:SDR family oxidoreductase n=1 Tax=unclassified Azospirillum TaxID=2630922 RepID=UPI003F4A19D0
MKIAVITGGSRGIGRASAIALAKRGCATVINYAVSTADADRTVREIEALGGTAAAVRADVAASAEVRTLFDTTTRMYGGVDIVVASAGIMTPSALADATDEDFDRLVRVNLRGTFTVFREAARRVRDGGRLIGFSSTTLALNAPGYGIYNATKGAVEGMVRVAAKELGPRGITVNAVAPGPIETELFLRGKSAADIERMAGMAPLERIGQPEDIAHLVAFLASPEAAWINGQVVRANGGIA